MAGNSDEQNVPQADAEQNASSTLAARRQAEQEFATSTEEFERKTEELTEANRRLLLLNQLANRLILGDHPQEQLNAAFDAAAELYAGRVHGQFAVPVQRR